MLLDEPMLYSQSQDCSWAQHKLVPSFSTRWNLPLNDWHWVNQEVYLKRVLIVSWWHIIWFWAVVFNWNLFRYWKNYLNRDSEFSGYQWGALPENVKKVSQLLKNFTFAKSPGYNCVTPSNYGLWPQDIPPTSQYEIHVLPHIFAPCVFDFCQYEHEAKFVMRRSLALLVGVQGKNHNINQSILVIDHQFKDTHLELIPINSGLNPLYKNV
jgi:hypothetical protein